MELVKDRVDINGIDILGNKIKVTFDQVLNQQTENIVFRNLVVPKNIKIEQPLKSLALYQCLVPRKESIGEVTGLNTLIANNTDWEGIKDIEKFPNIKRVYIKNSDNLSIETIGKKDTLEELSLTDEGIKNIQEVWQLPNLRMLDLSGNRIERIDFLYKCNNLKILKLSDNKIRDIETVKELKRLQVLELDGNPILNIEVLLDLPDLLLVNLSRTKIYQANMRVIRELENRGVKVNIYDTVITRY